MAWINVDIDLATIARELDEEQIEYILKIRGSDRCGIPSREAYQALLDASDKLYAAGEMPLAARLDDIRRSVF